MAWTIAWEETVEEDLAWFGSKESRLLVKTVAEQLTNDPVAESRNLKTFRPNPIAQRELRLHGKYRVLFNVDTGEEVVTVVVVGEKRGNMLIVRGKEYTRHHEGSSPE